MMLKEGEAQGYQYDGHMPSFMPPGGFYSGLDGGNPNHGMMGQDGKGINNNMNISSHMNSNNQNTNNLYGHPESLLYQGMLGNQEHDYSKHLGDTQNLGMPLGNMNPNMGMHMSNQNSHPNDGLPQMYPDPHDYMMMGLNFPQHFMPSLQRDLHNHHTDPFNFQKPAAQPTLEENKEKKQPQKRPEENAPKGDENQDLSKNQNKVQNSQTQANSSAGAGKPSGKPTADQSQTDKKVADDELADFGELTKAFDEKFQQIPSQEVEFQTWFKGIVEAMNSLEEFYKQICNKIRDTMKKKGTHNLEKLKSTYSRYIKEKLNYLDDLSKKQRMMHSNKCQFCHYYTPQQQPPIYPVPKFPEYNPYFPPYFYDIYQQNTGAGQGPAQKPFSFPQSGNGMMGNDFYFKNPKEDRDFYMNYQPSQGPAKGGNDFLFDQNFPGMNEDLFHHYQGNNQMNKKSD